MKALSFKDQRTISIVVTVGAIALTALIGLAFDSNTTLTMMRIVIMALFALSLNLQRGYGGIGNLGHSLYFGLGSYGVLLLAGKFGFSLIPACILSIAFCMTLSGILGSLLLRTGKMISFMFLSFGLCSLVYTMFTKSTFMGNTSGLTYIIRPAFMDNNKVLFIIIFAIALVCIFLISLLVRSPFVAVVEGSRENEERLKFLGVNITNLRLLLYVFSSTFGCIAGVLYAIMNNGAYISSIDIGMALQAMIMCVIGGGATLYGPIIGAVIVTLITNYLPLITSWYNVIFGLIIVAVCYFLTNGLTDRDGPIAKLFRKVVQLFKKKAPDKA